MIVAEEYPSMKRNIGLPEREIVTMEYLYYFESLPH
jgi:hypothetical protein